MFMEVVEPGYKPPCKETVLRRLRLEFDEVKSKISAELAAVTKVAIDTDCWTSCAMQGYITVNAHYIDSEWRAHTVSLGTEELDERHTAMNLSDSLQNVLAEWDLCDKVVASVNDNARNIVAAVSMLPNIEHDISCAGHNLHLSVCAGLETSGVQSIRTKASKIVTFFHHSVVATNALKKKQEQLGLPQRKLIQCVKTRWDSMYSMLERLWENRGPIEAVLMDRLVTRPQQAQKMEITEVQWITIQKLLKTLKPFQFATKVLSGAPVSMVRYVVRSIIDKHLVPDDDDCDEVMSLKVRLAIELNDRFKMEHAGNEHLSASQIASFLDPRCKNLTAETDTDRTRIRNAVKLEMSKYWEILLTLMRADFH